MKPKIPTCQHPNDPDSFYFRIMYREFFFGPFKTEQELINSVLALDAYDSYWDYDCVMYLKGKNPLPRDYVCGFDKIDDAIRDRLEKARKDAPVQQTTGTKACHLLMS